MTSLLQRFYSLNYKTHQKAWLKTLTTSLHSSDEMNGRYRNVQHKIAILIDGDNAESSLVAEFIAEAGKFGKVTVKRIYADWTSSWMTGWKDQLNTFAVRPMQKFAYTKSKNSTDTALIIDAMDLLNSNVVDGFCIVSSDSDYTGLAHRIREQGLFIMGIGRSHTPIAFVNACESFTFTEILRPASMDARSEKSNGVKNKEKPSTSNGKEVSVRTNYLIESKSARVSTPNSLSLPLVPETLLTVTNASSTAAMGQLASVPVNYKHLDIETVHTAYGLANPEGSDFVMISRLSDALRKIAPKFDYRKHGFLSFKKFCESLAPLYTLITKETSPGKTEAYICFQAKEAQDGEALSNKLHARNERSKEVNLKQSEFNFKPIKSLEASEIRNIDRDLIDRAFKMVLDIDTGRAMLSRFADALRKLDPSFDPRVYGFTSFRKFAEAMRPDYLTLVDGTTIYLVESNSEQLVHEIPASIALPELDSNSNICGGHTVEPNHKIDESLKLGIANTDSLVVDKLENEIEEWFIVGDNSEGFATTTKVDDHDSRYIVINDNSIENSASNVEDSIFDGEESVPISYSGGFSDTTDRKSDLQAEDNNDIDDEILIPERDDDKEEEDDDKEEDDDDKEDDDKEEEEDDDNEKDDVDEEGDRDNEDKGKFH